MNNNKIRITGCLFFMAFCCFGEGFDLQRVLRGITVDLELGKEGEISSQLADEFFDAITNETNQTQVLGYTHDWIEKYGDAFPESLLLHCLAGGKMDIVREKYGQLDSLVSKNCARWCLMVRDEVLDESIIPRNGKYFSCKDSSPSFRVIVFSGNDNRAKKSYFLKKRGLISRSVNIISDSHTVTRADRVPVPWSMLMFPDMSRVPFPLSRGLLESTSRWGMEPVSNRGLRIMGLVAPLIRVECIKLEPYGLNKVWDFFIANQPPFICVGEQPVSIARAGTSIEGNIHCVARILISKKKSKDEFYADRDLKQEVCITSPLGYAVQYDGERPRIVFGEKGNGKGSSRQGKPGVPGLLKLQMNMKGTGKGSAEKGVSR